MGFYLCQPLFEKKFENFNLAHCNLSFSSIFSRFWYYISIAISFFVGIFSTPFQYSDSRNHEKRKGIHKYVKHVHA